MFWRENLKLIVIAAVAGALVSNLATFAFTAITSDKESAKDRDVIASIPLRRTTTTTNIYPADNKSIGATTDTGPTQRAASTKAKNTEYTASAIDIAAGIFESEEISTGKDTETKSVAPKSKVEDLSLKCSFNDDSSPSHKSIILNEINWAGSNDNSNHEWIELKNISGSELDISGYEIIDLKEQLQIKVSNGVTLPKNALYVLKRGEGSLNISAPVYSGALSNSSEGIRIFSPNCDLEDEALADPSWPAGDSKERLTMERESDLSWHSSEKSGGTPAKTNSKGQSEPEPEVVSEPEPKTTQEEQNTNQGVFEGQEQANTSTTTATTTTTDTTTTTPSTSTGCDSGQININTASLEELDEIKWVGPSTAQNIIDARPFASLDELDDKVSGIGESKLADIISEGKACAE